MRLIDAIPTSVHPQAGSGWCFIFGEGIVGHEVGAVYLIPGKPHYTRFKVVPWREKGSNAPPLPAYQEIGERPLTPEEIAHFEALAQTYSPNSST